MSSTYQEEDATQGNVDAFYYPGEERLEIVTYPQTSSSRLLDALEEESKAWELSKYTDEEIKAEYEKRFPF